MQPNQVVDPAQSTKLEHDNQILKKGVCMLNKKLEVTKRDNESYQRTLRDKEYENGILRARTESLERKVKEHEPLRQRLLFYETRLLSYQVSRDFTLHDRNNNGFGPSGGFGGDGAIDHWEKKNVESVVVDRGDFKWSEITAY